MQKVKIEVGGSWGTFNFTPEVPVWVTVDGVTHKGTLSAEVEVISETPISGRWWQKTRVGFNGLIPRLYNGEGLIKEIKVLIQPATIGGVEMPVEKIAGYYFPRTYKVTEGGVMSERYEEQRDGEELYDAHPTNQVEYFCREFRYIDGELYW